MTVSIYVISMAHLWSTPHMQIWMPLWSSDFAENFGEFFEIFLSSKVTLLIHSLIIHFGGLFFIKTLKIQGFKVFCDQTCSSGRGICISTQPCDRIIIFITLWGPRGPTTLGGGRNREKKKKTKKVPVAAPTSDRNTTTCYINSSGRTATWRLQ